MKVQKESRKTQYTRRVIKESFLQLMETKPLKEITVKEITELADINRATFYAHYENVEDLIRTLEMEMAEAAIEAIDKLYQSGNYEANVIDALFDTLLQDRQLCKWFMGNQTTGYGQSLIYDYAKSKCVPEWCRVAGISAQHADYCFSYIYNGAFGLLKKWYDDDDKENWKETRDLFQEIVHDSLQYVYGTGHKNHK